MSANGGPAQPHRSAARERLKRRRPTVRRRGPGAPIPPSRWPRRYEGRHSVRVRRAAGHDANERWFPARNVSHWLWLLIGLSAVIRIPDHLVEPLLALDLAILCSGVAMFVRLRRPGVGLQTTGIIVRSPYSMVKGASQRVVPWTAVAAFDHPESRLGGSDSHGVVELKTTDGEIVVLPSVRDTRALIGALRRYVPGPANLR